MGGATRRIERSPFGANSRRGAGDHGSARIHLRARRRRHLGQAETRLTRTPDAQVLLCLKRLPSTDPPEGEVVMIQAEGYQGHPAKVLDVSVAPMQPTVPLWLH